MHKSKGSARAVVASVVVVALAAVAGCSSKSGSESSTGTSEAPRPATVAAAKPDRVVPTQGTPKTGGAAIVGVAAETDSLNPYVGQWSNSSYLVANAMIEPLAAIDDKGIAKPYLAESIQPAGDFMSWTITLRPGVTFHDDTPLDASALKRNLETGRKSGLTAQAFNLITSIDTVGSLQVKVNMSKPWATFPASLAMQSGYVVAPAMLDDPAAANAKPVGTGPFVYQDRQRDAYTKTKKNTSYWRKDDAGVAMPYLESVEFRVLADASSRSNALAAGDIDAMEVLTPDAYRQAAAAASRGEVQMITNVGWETDETVFAMNTAKEPFDDLGARQAVQYATDQKKLSEQAYQSAFPGSWGMFEEGSPYYISPESAGYPKPDLAKAKDLAAEYQRTHGKKLEFTALVPPDPQYLAIAQSLKSQLEEAGIVANLQAIEQTQLIRTVIATGDYQAAGFVLRGSPSPDQSYVFIATKANPSGLSLNFSRLDDPEIVAGMDAFRAASTPDARVEAIATVQKRLAADVPMVFLVNARTGFVASNSLRGLKGTTFPGTQATAQAPYPTTPFYTAMWKAPAGS